MSLFFSLFSNPCLPLYLFLSSHSFIPSLPFPSILPVFASLLPS